VVQNLAPWREWRFPSSSCTSGCRCRGIKVGQCPPTHSISWIFSGLACRIWRSAGNLAIAGRSRSQRRPWELIAELGFRWTADYVSSDVPQLLNVNRRRIISLGYAPPGCNDGDLISHSLGEALADAKYTFDATFAESKRHPMKFCYVAYTHWSGTPSMAQMLADLLAYVRAFEPAPSLMPKPPFTASVQLPRWQHRSAARARRRCLCLAAR
jgi:hypothetical protein